MAGNGIGIEGGNGNPTKPKSDADSQLVFISDQGHRWVRCRENGTWIDLIGGEFRQLVLKCGVTGTGKSFYSLRRTFRTIADAAGDQPAAVFIMGHADSDDDMSATYRQGIDDKRLKAVSQYRSTMALSRNQRNPVKLNLSGRGRTTAQTDRRLLLLTWGPRRLVTRPNQHR